MSILARIAQTLAGGLVERVEPEGLLPREDGRARAVPLPLSIAQVLQRTGGRLQRYGLAKRLGGQRVITRTVGSYPSLKQGLGR